MKKSNTYSGKMIAVILVLLFLGINFFKSETDGGPQEKHFAKTKRAQEQSRKFENNLAKPQDIKKLQFAYTGKWEKNDVKNQDGQFAFNTPDSTRNTMSPTAAKKAADDKKKKLAKKSKKTKNKLAKKYNKKGRYSKDSAFNDDAPTSPYSVTSYYTAPANQERTPSDEDKEKKLTAQEWFSKINTENSISSFLSEFSSGKVDSSTFYATIEMLLSDSKDSNKKLGYQALQAVPSYKSLELYAKHVNDEMSPEVKAFAQSTLNAYNQPQHLKALNSALNSSNDDLKIIAALLIKEITTEVLAAQDAGTDKVVYTEVQIKNFRTMLTQSLNVIENALKTNLAAEVVASFNSTLAVLHQFLG